MLQSILSYNLTTVNAPDKCKVRLERREQRRENQKWEQDIEINHARKMYLNTYYRIDTIDHLIKNYHIYYPSWKH